MDFYFPDIDGGAAAQLDFMASWIRVCHVPFHDVLSNAARLADETPLWPSHNRGEHYRVFINLAAWLQYLRGDDEIYLPTRKIAAILSCDQQRSLAFVNYRSKTVSGLS